MSKLKPIELDDGETSKELIKAIANLPYWYKMVFKLRAIEKLPYTKIAKKLDISESKSKRYYSKAKIKLQTLLDNHILNIQKAQPT